MSIFNKEALQPGHCLIIESVGKTENVTHFSNSSRKKMKQSFFFHINIVINGNYLFAYTSFACFKIICKK